MLYQRTLAHPAQAVGIGLHSGDRVHMTLTPLPPDSGIVFRRTDLPGQPSLQVAPRWVNDTRMSTTLIDGDLRIGTIEHLMSALAAFGIDNLRIDLDAQEVPIMDGSATTFLYLLAQARVVEQKRARKVYLKITRPIEVRDGDKWVRFSPHEGYIVQLSIQFDHPVFQRSAQTLTLDFSTCSYIDTVARARTFGFIHEVEYLRLNNLGRGGSMENAIVLDNYRVLNPGGLRFPDEFVRHKALDAIGDLYVLGQPIVGRFEGYKCGHAINNRLMRALLEAKDSSESIRYTHEADVPAAFHPYQLANV